MPRVKLTKTAIDALPTPSKDIVHWDTGCPGFGVKVTPKGRKIFIVLYRTAGAGSRLRKYTIGPYGRVTLNQARVTAQRTPAEGWWLTGLMICLKPLSPSTFHKIDPRRKSHGCSAERSRRHGAVAAFTKSANAM